MALVLALVLALAPVVGARGAAVPASSRRAERSGRIGDGLSVREPPLVECAAGVALETAALPAFGAEARGTIVVAPPPPLRTRTLSPFHGL